MERLAGVTVWSDFPDHTGGTVDWEQRSYPITGSGSHTLKWRYVKDGSGSYGYDCGWVDYVQWSGVLDNPLPTDWTTVGYTYDPAGWRIAKSYDGTVVARYIYDGPQTIAEYDGNNRLLRKYVHGPAVDQPICMIDANETSYYHYDGLGSVVALSDAAGDAAVLYEYGIYGQAAASDPNHPNPFLFTGREFDKETGLYYYRARYYNATIGRFLQTDPIGYGDGMNVYRYCGNCPVIFVDPSGLKHKISVAFYDGSNPAYAESANDFRFAYDMSGVSDPLAFIEECLNSLNSDVLEITDVYFYDDYVSTEAITGTHIVTLGFGYADYAVEEDGDLEKFFIGLGDLICVFNGLDPARNHAGPDDPIVHLRQSYAAADGSAPLSDTGICWWLSKYSEWSGLRTTAVDGMVEHTGAEQEWGLDYTYKADGMRHYGRVYISDLFTYPTSGRETWNGERLDYVEWCIENNRREVAGTNPSY